MTLETEGLYDAKDKEKTGEATPFFVFAFEEYDPDPHHLSELSGQSWHDPFYSPIVETHRYLYSQFLNIDKIASNIKLNNLLSSEQLDRFWVHYNYLSSFTHPTKRGLLATDAMEYSSESGRKDRFFETLILMYAAHFQAMLIRLMAAYFSDRNKFTDLSVYIKQAEKLEEASKDFWFIYNNPTEFDIDESEMQKKWKEVQHMQVPSGVLYYSDPYERLKRILIRRET